MAKPLLIISPDYPPVRGGVSDHTARLALELSARTEVSVLTSAKTHPGPVPDGVSVHPVITDWKDRVQLLAAIARTSPNGDILWQYVPHMYGRGGVNLRLPGAIASLAGLGRSQMVLAHEIAAPLSCWPQRLFYALAQRWEWGRILSCVQDVGISTEAWLLDWQARTGRPGSRLFLAPSPSSIPVVATARDHRHAWKKETGLPENAVVLTFFGTLSGAKQWSWLSTVWERLNDGGPPVALVFTGARPELSVPDRLKSLLKPLGYLPPEDVSRALQATDVLALPFIDGVSERRTSFMAGLSHGCAVVTTTGHNTGPTLRSATFFASAPADDERAFQGGLESLLRDPARRTLLAQAGLAASETYGWKSLIERLWLQLNAIGAPVKP